MGNAGTAILVCPRCRVDLEGSLTAGLHCRRCEHDYPVVAGIADLRLEPDRYLSLADDRAKAEALAALPGGFADVLAAYWRQTPEVPARLAAHYVERALDAARRADAHLERLGSGPTNVLDVGCGTGGMLIAAARRGIVPVGVDIALRWLVVARRALLEEGIDALVVAADGARLPFRRQSFDLVTCIEALEHTADQRGLVHACLAAARPEGHAYLVTANRFSLAPDPTLALWGTGLLPRRVSPGYVRWRRGTRSQFYRPPSRSRLRSLVGPLPGVAVGPAPLPSPPAAPAAVPSAVRATYEALRRAPLGRRVLGPTCPYLEVVS